MLGRVAYHDPYILALADSRLFGEPLKPRAAIVAAMGSAVPSCRWPTSRPTTAARPVCITPITEAAVPASVAKGAKVLIGGEPPFPFLRSMGVQFGNELPAEARSN